MRNRLRIEVRKNGKRVGTIGCPNRGILSVTIDFVGRTLTGHTIDVPGGAKYDERARWSFGAVAVGDVVTFHLIEGGPCSRPLERERDTPEQAIANAKRHRLFLRERRAQRLEFLRTLLRTGDFPSATHEPSARAGDAALKVQLGDRVVFTAGAPSADELSATVRGIFRPHERAPSFEVDADARIRGELRKWKSSVERGTIVRVEVLASAQHSRPESLSRVRRPAPLSTAARVKREIARCREGQRGDEHRFRTVMALNLERISKRAVVAFWATVSEPGTNARRG